MEHIRITMLGGAIIIVVVVWLVVLSQIRDLLTLAVVMLAPVVCTLSYIAGCLICAHHGKLGRWVRTGQWEKHND